MVRRFLRVDRPAAGRVGPAKRTSASVSVRMSRMTVLGGALLSQCQGGILTRATVLVPRSAVTTGPRDLGIEATPPLKAVAHACEARTGFDTLTSTQRGFRRQPVNGRFSSEGRSFFVGSADRSTLESGCARTCLTGPGNGYSLDIANAAVREDF